MSGLWRRNCLYNVQVAGLALHALEPDEEIDVLEHLPRCPSCRAALDDAERVLAGLGAGVEQADPPASLRGSILAEAAETVQGPGGTPAPVEHEPEPAVAAAPRHRVPGRPPTRSAEHRTGLSRRARLVAASLVVAGLVAIGGLTAYSAQVTSERDAEITAARTLAEIVTGLDRPGALHATLATPDGRALAAVVVQDGQRTLVTAGLDPNATDRETYVLWGIGDSGPRAVGAFDVLGAGTDVRVVGPDVPGDGFTTYAISIEPGRAAPVAPSTVVAVGPLEA